MTFEQIYSQEIDAVALREELALVSLLLSQATAMQDTVAIAQFSAAYVTLSAQLAGVES